MFKDRRADGKWQIVPYTSCSDIKCSVADGAALYSYCGSQTLLRVSQQPSAGLLPGTPHRRGVTTIAEVVYGQSEFNRVYAPGTQLMKVPEQWNDKLINASDKYQRLG